MAAFVIVWQFDVVPIHLDVFERVYGPAGEWAALFARSPDFLGTQLLRDTHDRVRFLTIDRWESAEAFHKFEREHADHYTVIDRKCAELTLREEKLGEFEDLDPRAMQRGGR